MFPLKRIVLLCAAISLPLIYGTNDFGTQLDKYLFNNPEEPTEKKKVHIVDRGTFLRYIALMQLYACGAPRTVNSKFFTNPDSFKNDLKQFGNVVEKEVKWIARLKN